MKSCHLFVICAVNWDIQNNIVRGYLMLLWCWLQEIGVHSCVLMRDRLPQRVIDGFVIDLGVVVVYGDGSFLMDGYRVSVGNVNQESRIGG